MALLLLTRPGPTPVRVGSRLTKQPAVLVVQRDGLAEVGAIVLHMFGRRPQATIGRVAFTSVFMHSFFLVRSRPGSSMPLCLLFCLSIAMLIRQTAEKEPTKTPVEVPGIYNYTYTSY